MILFHYQNKYSLLRKPSRAHVSLGKQHLAPLSVAQQPRDRKWRADTNLLHNVREKLPDLPRHRFPPQQHEVKIIELT